MTYKPVLYKKDEFLKEIINDPEARAIYEATNLQLELSMKLKKARIKRNMTQDDVAEIMHTKKTAISRIEAVNDDVKHFPSLLTLAKYAAAVGYTLDITFNPIRQKTSLKTRSQATRTK